VGEKFLWKSVRKTGVSECDGLDITSCLLSVSVCADYNVCLSRVMSLSPQFVWKYSTGKFTRIEGDGKHRRQSWRDGGRDPPDFGQGVVGGRKGSQRSQGVVGVVDGS